MHIDIGIYRFDLELDLYSTDSIEADEYTRVHKFIKLHNNRYGIGFYITTNRFRLFVGWLKYKVRFFRFYTF